MDECQTCKFWMDIGEEPGLCRRYPPLAGTEEVLAGGVCMSASTSATDWCGEFQPEAESPPPTPTTSLMPLAMTTRERQVSQDPHALIQQIPPPQVVREWLSQSLANVQILRAILKVSETKDQLKE